MAETLLSGDVPHIGLERSARPKHETTWPMAEQAKTEPFSKIRAIVTGLSPCGHFQVTKGALQICHEVATQ
jgi:hypothetical protein